MRTRVEVAKSVLEAVDLLSEEMGHAQSEPLDARPSSADQNELISLLEQLIIRRIQVTMAFELLAHLDPIKATSLVLRRYLGENVNPDRKYGGYESELDSILGDLALVGVEHLTRLVRSPKFDCSKARDQRVVRSFCNALQLESEEELKTWLKSQWSGGACKSL